MNTKKLIGVICGWVLPITAQAALNIYPASTTVELSTKVPFVCDVGNGAANGVKCSWKIISGAGAIDANGIYTAPASTGLATVEATYGTVKNTAIVHVSGSLPSYSCTYSNRGTNFNKCTMFHKETVGSATRYYNVIIPQNYVPNQSGLIVNLGNTSHGIHTYPTGAWCDAIHAGSESGGWGPYILSLPSPSPILVCVEADFDTTVQHPERWNFWGNLSAAVWDNGVVPNDPDFVRQVILATVRDLNLDPKKVFLTDDWHYGAKMIDQVAIYNTDLIAAIGSYNAPFLPGVDKNFIIQGGRSDQQKVPALSNPISMIRLGSDLRSASSSYLSLCGTNSAAASNYLRGTSFRPLNDDDAISYYNKIDGIAAFVYKDNGTNSTTKFCAGTYSVAGVEAATKLEYALGVGGRGGTSIVEYKLVGNAKVTPWCSFDWSGKDTFCSDVVPTLTNSGPPLDLRNSQCDWIKPCNHYVDATTGYDIKGLVYKFFVAHPKP